MSLERYVMDTVMAVATHFARKGVEITIDKAKDIIVEIFKKNPSLRGQIDVDAMAVKIQTSAAAVGRVAYNEETLARFLEIPLPDLASVNSDSLDMGVLYDHVRLEGEFIQWLSEWGYEVESGCEKVGLKGIEYLPDIYGVLKTLHGEFEVCVSLVCDSPPSEDRVFALLGKIEAYSENKSEFSTGDVFIVATPRRFTQASINAITLQNEQEKYYAMRLEGGDIHALEKAEDSKERLNVLEDKIRQAEDESRRAKIRRNATESV